MAKTEAAKPPITKDVAVKQVHIPMTQEPQGSAAIMALISRFATDQSLDVAKLDHLLAVKERWEKEEARKAFVIALNNFKADPPDVFKDKKVSFETGKGKTEYTHASLDKVSSILGASGAVHGLSHRWETAQGADGRVGVTCILTHIGGHSERVTLTAPADSSGSKNSIQAIASTVSYLERYTVMAAYGVASHDQEDDGRGGKAAKIAGPEDPPEDVKKPEVVCDPVKFKQASTPTKKGKAFTIHAPLLKYQTLDEKVAVIARDAFKADKEIGVLATIREDVYWIDSLDVIEPPKAAPAGADEF
jgi:hypothetical protein